MISTDDEYCAALKQSRELITWHEDLESGSSPADPLTISNIHSRLQKLHGEMADYQRRLIHVESGIIDGEP